MKSLAFVFCCGVLVASVTGEEPLPALKEVPPFQAIPLPRSEISLQIQGRELTRYLAPADQPRPFWFPLAHSSGRSLTRMGHPHDPFTHSHHNSVWISHQNVAGANFWEDKHAGSGPSIIQEKVEKLWDGPDACGATVVNGWFGTGAEGKRGRLLLRERRSFAARRVAGVDPSTGWWLLIDLEFSTASDPTVTFGESPFGLIGVRMAKTIGVNDGGGRILNSEGAVNEPAIFRKPARWVDYSGALTAEGAGGITLMDHPQNAGHPAPFHVRNDGWMGACLTLAGPREIKSGSPLRLRYALFCHDRILDAAQLELRWKEFAASAALAPSRW